MKRILFATLLCLSCHVAYAVDTDGDGLLDLVDTPGFDPAATGDIDYCCRHIQDLDGANLLVDATTISLSGNQIANIENGDFEDLVGLEQLGLASNRITSIESGDFAGLDNLQRLYLFSNQITSVESGDFDGLGRLRQLYLFDFDCFTEFLVTRAPAIPVRWQFTRATCSSLCAVPRAAVGLEAMVARMRSAQHVRLGFSPARHTDDAPWSPVLR